ncbi:ANTH domain-containing protein [Cytidiella melzeri]|nr:ANTH domain-containing protein [Cytidiella melzeri]
MSSSFDKAVKGACKPKAAPPKPKYLDPIIAATWSEDGAVHDVCKALTPRLKEPNALVVFKALIVLHTMIRNGATDNVLAYLSSSDVLRLRNISAGHWEGYNAPQNLQNYAIYLDTRIKAYRDLKHDAIRVQSETNRDMRNSAAIEEDKQFDHEKKSRFGRRKGRDTDEGIGSLPGGGPQRSKTIVGRKLRVMTVEKGLLRETKIVQKQIDALVETRFYLDDLEDELNITALRMLVKDLLILFQACNEGVINVLEHYFEMSKIDAKEALAVYRHFCKETERVVEYLGVAKKLQNLLNVPIPNLRHAPVSLAGSLEEYLNDPNFEQNRIEYKTNKEIADRNTKSGFKASPNLPQQQAPNTKPSTSTQPAASTSAVAASDPGKNPQAMMDFFTAIEEEQQTIFNPSTNSPTSNYFQQQAAANPFAQRQAGAGQPFTVPQMQTGQPFGASQNQMQQTVFVAPQQTGFNPFGQQQSVQGFGGGLQPQPTGFLAPQMTGANPFRQSMMFPQMTGVGPFGFSQQQPQTHAQVSAPTGKANPFPSVTGPFGQQQPQANSNPFPTTTHLQQQPQLSQTNPFPHFSSQQNVSGTSNPFPSFSSTASAAPVPVSPAFNPAASGSAANEPPRSASVPLSSGPSDPAPLKTHQTGSRNPFGVPVASAPPIPKAPTLFEIATGKNTPQQPQGNGATSPTSLNPHFTGFSSAGGPNGSVIASVASEFAFSSPNNNTHTANGLSGLSFTSNVQRSTSPTATGSTASTSLFSSLSSQPTGTTSSSPSALQPQSTGFGGLKAFKPSSSFGAALLESLPPIPQSAPTTPSEQPKHTPTGSLGSSTLLTTQATGRGPGSPFGASSGLGTASTVGVGLRPQATGLAGSANPFRATMFSLSPGPTSTTLGGNSPFNPNGNAFGSGLGGGLGSGLGPTPTGLPSQFGSGATSAFGGAFGASSSAPTSFNAQPQQQQSNQSSLI